MSDLKQFLELFNPYPGNSYLEISSGTSETTIALQELLNGVDGSLDLVIYSDDKSDLKEQFPNSKVQQIDDLSKPFRAMPRSADIVILKDFFHLHKNQDMIIKTAYTALANTADIIIMEKKGIMDIEATYEMLERLEFRASNLIEVLPEYDLIMAKKMHMWGNGL
ncbi:MAG: hypothetical protein U9P38_04730 [Campylobacterota bacterium]|nr:hypothetical protein [Campylobacterota bacterium]